VIRSASGMIAVAPRMEREMQAIFPWARTCTVWNGTDPIPANIREKGRPPDLDGKTVLFSCGAFYPRKGFPLLIEAFARVADKFPDAILRIAGDGDERSEVENAVRRHGLGGRVQLLGFQPHEAVLAEMCSCDAFVLLGWDEPFATVFTEALSAGKPIICASDGGIAEVIAPNVHGLVVAPKDVEGAAAALSQILSSRSVRERLGTAAQMLFERMLKWDHNAMHMKELFLQAVLR
jgi:glycosyltransferase involved in cell wall biosynthesis